MKGKMNPTEVLSVGRGDWCSGHVLIYFQKLLPDYLPLSELLKMKYNRSRATDLIVWDNEHLCHHTLKYATINTSNAKWEYLKRTEINLQ